MYLTLHLHGRHLIQTRPKQLSAPYHLPRATCQQLAMAGTEMAYNPPSPPNEFDRITLETLKSYYPAVVALIGTVGAQMTFAVVVADLPETTSSVLDKEDVRNLMVASWFMFVTLIFAGVASGLIGLLNHEALERGWFREHPGWLLYAITCNLTVITIGFAAFGCMAAAMAAYTNVGVGGFSAWFIGGGYLITMFAVVWSLAGLRKCKSTYRAQSNSGLYGKPQDC